ncbi:DUF6670 family protein [Amycolatopsis sp. w19]|uniref:DUF6670 family protein n=1 Tax=Amycolatopsis sp. w19 TaxID=3448134 RepID=UPI003F1A1078
MPRLPAPLRYLNTMTFIGATGTVCFDNDHLARPDARRTATVLSSTAAPGHHHYRAYDTRTDCRFAADGSRLAWGEDLVIEADLRADADLRPSQPASDQSRDRHRRSRACRGRWSLHRRIRAMRYTASTLPQPGVATLEAAGRLAHVRTLGGSATVFQDVSVEVTPREEPEIDPQGRAMRVPRAFRWTVRDGDEEVAVLDGTVDTPLRYGHGRGYVGAYSFEAAFRSRAVSGTGYFEWVDCEDR